MCALSVHATRSFIVIFVYSSWFVMLHTLTFIWPEHLCNHMSLFHHVIVREVSQQHMLSPRVCTVPRIESVIKLSQRQDFQTDRYPYPVKFDRTGKIVVDSQS